MSRGKDTMRTHHYANVKIQAILEGLKRPEAKA